MSLPGLEAPHRLGCWQMKPRFSLDLPHSSGSQPQNCPDLGTRAHEVHVRYSPKVLLLRFCRWRLASTVPTATVSQISHITTNTDVKTLTSQHCWLFPKLLTIYPNMLTLCCFSWYIWIYLCTCICWLVYIPDEGLVCFIWAAAGAWIPALFVNSEKAAARLV